MGNHGSGTTTLSASLALQTGATAEVPLVVHKDTRIGAIGSEAAVSRYIFATNDAGRIIGLVPRHEICERLQVGNDRERARWSEMSIASLISVSFPTSASVQSSPVSTLLDCTVIVENGHLIGIVTQDDVFLSWHRLAAVVTGAASDPLTGLMNRLAYERRLNEEWNRAVRTGCSIGVIVIDLDHFKSINDQYGHAAGDSVLRDVAETLERSLRSYDILARYGGDEFIALCLGCPPGQIEIPIRRMLTKLRASPFAVATGFLPIWASIGAAVRHDGFSESDPSEMFAVADRCLFRAKECRGMAVWTELGSDWQEERTVSDGGAVAAHGYAGTAFFEEASV